ncbi:Dolichyl-phosphate-mannose-protein mannosyltransferase-domain-containing protein [Gorgonomyces haynaldii]|nr:Dolichyl-phosphate-mannose-protein mannosyltransferase-domain-containing protein [Gorgonomyces haynaldii]
MQPGLRQRIKPTLQEERVPLLDEKIKRKRTYRPLPEGHAWIALVLLGIALWTRLYKIQWSSRVVWDEAHFGKFAGYYIKRTFYFDVHPPLGKMLNGFAGLIAGFNGTFEFESGVEYPQELKYGVMRFFNGLFGAFITPLAYYTGIHLRLSHTGAILLAWLTIVEVALCTISRFILLDSMLLFFTALSAYALVVFRNYQVSEPFSPDWFLWIAISGLSLGLVVSVKWVGLFVIALVGLHTLDDLWEMLGDLKMPLKTYASHWAARISFLIVLPVSVYMFTFVMHFAILNRSGPGDAQMSSLFQAGLQGINFASSPLELAYGSKVTIKNSGRGGALLHSHVQRYPSGSEQQQVTCYSHKDSNNDWIVEKIWGVSRNESEVEFIEDGAIVRLVHANTKKSLHSHAVPAPITTTENEVSGYGNETSGDTNDHWVIERVEDLTGAKSKRIRSLSTRFRIKHLNSGCLLRADRVSLPQWGFKQEEVVCQKKADKESRNNMWNIEEHSHPLLPPGGANAYRSSFWMDFVDLNVAMWTSNNALTPDPDKEPDALTSQPYHWPLLLRGLRMCGWGNDQIKFYLLGNPLIYWGAALSLVVLSVTFVVYLIRQRRGYKDFISFDEWDDFYFGFKVSVIGWLLHYLPFYIMGRVMYVHHYFPALYFGIISMSFTLDHFCRKLPKPFGPIVLIAIGAVCTLVFLYFADFAFGFDTPASEYKGRRWIKSWNIYDE